MRENNNQRGEKNGNSVRIKIYIGLKLQKVVCIEGIMFKSISEETPGTLL